MTALLYRQLILEPSDEVVGYVKLLAALVEHSSEWIVAHIKQPDVQSFLATLLRISGWAGTGGVDESVSEVSEMRKLCR